MNPAREHTSMVNVGRALLFLRVRELASGGTAARLALIFGATLGLLLLVVERGDEEVFFGIAQSYFLLGLVPVLALTKGGDALRSELRDGTMEYLWTRPARRSHLFLGLFASALLGILANLGACLAGLVVAGVWLGVWTSSFALVGFALCTVVGAFGFGAISAAFGAYSSRFVALGVFYYLFVERALGQIDTGVRHASIGSHIGTIMEAARYETVIAGGASVVGGLGVVLGIGVVALLVGAAVFVGSSSIAGAAKE